MSDLLNYSNFKATKKMITASNDFIHRLKVVIC